MKVLMNKLIAVFMIMAVVWSWVLVLSIDTPKNLRKEIKSFSDAKALMKTIGQWLF